MWTAPCSASTAGARDGRVRHLAVHRDFHLQAAVVRRDHLVAEAGGDHQVRLGEALGEQPARAQEAAEFLVVGEVQLDAALGWLGDRLERRTAKVKLAKSLLLTAAARP
jgi:hypothetical protein